jgi:hypothetical protein
MYNPEIAWTSFYKLYVINLCFNEDLRLLCVFCDSPLDVTWSKTSEF